MASSDKSLKNHISIELSQHESSTKAAILPKEKTRKQRLATRTWAQSSKHAQANGVGRLPVFGFV